MKIVGKVKIIAITILLILTGGFLFASGKKDTTKTNEKDNVIHVFGTFRGEEAARFQEIVNIFNKKTGYNVVYEGSPEFETQIQVEAEAGTPPDIAALPQPGTMKAFAAKGYIKPLPDDVVKAIDENYASVWKNLGSYNGKVYGLFHRVSAKSFVWYNKKAFAAKGYIVPKTWKELEALENKMVANGDVPWSIGFESGNSTGWVGTDWLEDIVLRTAGPEVYDKWVNHEIPFNDPAIKKALKICGSIFLNPKYVYGGATNILTTSYGDAIKPLFENPPKAYMNLNGNFITSFMPQDVQDNLAEDVGIFALPPIDTKFGTPIEGGGDQYVMFSNKPGVAEFLKFLTTWEACAPWAKIGGAIFPQKNQNFDDYGNEIEKDIAKILVNAKVFRFDGSDMMPTEVGSGTFWTGMVDYVSGEDADSVLTTIEDNWPTSE